jgi:DNA-binding winged helix-turn-helix (wHTH) protein
MQANNSEAVSIRFDVFELELKSGELRRAGELIKLQPQPFKLLAFLAAKAGQVVTREEIQQEIWGGETFVDYEQGVRERKRLR